MKIAAIKEQVKGEHRTAITPEVAKMFTSKGYNVFVEKNIGTAANFIDADYISAGATVSNIPLEILSDADIILKVQPTPLIDEFNEIDMEMLKRLNECELNRLGILQYAMITKKEITPAQSIVSTEVAHTRTVVNRCMKNTTLANFYKLYNTLSTFCLSTDCPLRDWYDWLIRV